MVKRLNDYFECMSSSMLNDILGELREIKELLRIIANDTHRIQ